MPSRILASTSPYRAELLRRLQLKFDVRAPEVDETPQPGDSPPDLALRLALAKAKAVADKVGNGLVIGSDQVAHCDGRLLGKPGGHDAAIAQLRLMRGRKTTFDTALALVNATTGHAQTALVSTVVTLRQASDAEIEAYVSIERPFDCAGSAKSEGLGIALMESIEGGDPTALVGLPLIALTGMLRAENVQLFAAT